MASIVVTLTTEGRKMEAQQLLYGYGFKVEFFVLGSGGHDPGNPTIALPINPDVTSLPGQFFGPEPIDVASLLSPTCPQFICIAQPGEAVGGISNIGLIATVHYVPGASFSFLPAQVDVSTNTIEKSAHGLTLNQTVTLSTTGALPGGLAPSTTYYVISPTTDTFQLSLTASGPPIDILSQGFGTHSLTYGSIPGAPTVGDQFLYALSNFPLRYKLAATRETFNVTVRT